MTDILKITNASNGITFNVVIRAYKSNDPEWDGRPLVVFYDDRWKTGGFDPVLGQQVSSYFASTLLEDAERLSRGGLDLQGDVPSWKVDPDQMAKVIEFIGRA